MKTYRCVLQMVYEFDAEDKEDLITVLADTVKQDWIYYIDEFEITELPNYFRFRPSIDQDPD